MLTMKIISKSEVQKIINMTDTLEYVEKVFVEYAAGKTVMPPRPVINVEDHHGSLLIMPAYIPGSQALGVKVVSVYPDNRAKNIRTIFAMLVLNDASTGEPIAIMDAEVITAYRTGAISGVAAKYLALEDADTVAIWGAGVQGRQQLVAICAVRKIKKIFVFDVNPPGRDKFVEEMKALLGIEVVGCDNEDEAMSQSQIIITATTSATPIITGKKLQPGTFISAVGGSTSQKQEIPEHIVGSATIIVDGYGAALKDAGDLLIPISKGIITEKSVKGDLGEVVTGKVKRSNKEEIILFKTVGLALQDICVAPHIYKKALEMGLGTEVSMS